ncbi:hypothetical protein [Fimbriiglobus ruber]|nr:hypothetical protein [Fimbriiglobus ruber]
MDRPFSVPRPRAIRLVPRLYRWGVLGSAALVGCESVRPTTVPDAAAGNGARAQVAAAAPKKPGGTIPPLRVSKFVFYADVPLAAEDALFRELEELPDQLQRELHIPDGNNVVQVFLFEDQDKYEAFMRERFPWLPVRRAYFIADQKRPGATDDLQVYTWMGENLRTDLRHELTHAMLHAVLKGVPLWLDEGLAGFFEQPPGNDGVNPDHLEKLRKGPFVPDLARLENIGKVAQMEKPEYREAWAWVHFMLRGDPKAKAALLEYLDQLRTNPNPGPLLPRLAQVTADPNKTLADYLARVEIQPPPAPRGRAADK